MCNCPMPKATFIELGIYHIRESQLNKYTFRERETFFPVYAMN